MTLRRTLEDYGAPYKDQEPVRNPTVQISAAFDNRALEDQAHLTRTSDRAKVQFDTDAAAAQFDYLAEDVNHHHHLGSGDAQKPTVRKLAVGHYRITYAANLTDALSVVEPNAFFDAQVSVRSVDVTDDLYSRIVSVSSNVVELIVESPKGTLADVGDQSGNPVTICARLD